MVILRVILLKILKMSWKLSTHMKRQFLRGKQHLLPWSTWSVWWRPSQGRIHCTVFKECADPYHLSNCSHVQCWGVYSGTQFSICVLYSRERPCSRHAFPRVFAQQWFIIGRAVLIPSPILWFEFRLTQVGKHNINTAEAARRNPVITIPGNIENNYWFGLLSLKTLQRLQNTMLMVYERFITY